MPDFPHEPFTDFSQRAQRESFARALEEARRDLGREHPLLLHGRDVTTDRWIESINPAHPAQIIGRVAQAGPAEVEDAVRAAAAAQARWGRTPVAQRAELLRNAAKRLRAHHHRLAALEVLEVGKTWREADVDVVEAIEYLEYYSASMLELAAGRPLIQRPGEANRYRYRPRGVCAVIAPWNFPSAIFLGMASAALAAGNVVILKPSRQSSVIGASLAGLLRDAGFPGDVVQYLPGRGDEVGRALVQHPDVHVIMFTGSKAAGLSILEAVGRVAPGQRFIKQVVAEMGGKNALIVDEDADVDEAIKGILASAFGYQGQKCSAASRLIVHAAVWEPLMSRLRGAMESLIVCDPVQPECDLGPLIDAAAQQRLGAAGARADRELRLIARYPHARLPAEGYFVGPSFYEVDDPQHPLAQEELFGPLVCAFRVLRFEDALDVANATDYGLTGGIYSRSPSHIQQAMDAVEVGNFYINRPITGAMVGRQPFGGYKLSGLGTKAGGPDYLLSLMVPQTICENTARHGMPLE